MQPQIELLSDEEIRFQDDQVIVTSRRLIGNLDSSPVGKYTGINLSEVGPPNKFNGGRYGRKGLGLRLMFGGLAIIVARGLNPDAVRPQPANRGWLISGWIAGRSNRTLSRP